MQSIRGGGGARGGLGWARGKGCTDILYFLWGGGARGKGCTDILYFRGGARGKGCTDILYFLGLGGEGLY